MGVSPFLYPQEWDTILVGGEGGTPSPGICEIAGAKPKNEWDVKRGKGAQGAQYTYNGLEPARFTATFTLWRSPGITGPSDPDDYEDWLAFVALLKYDPTRKDIQAVDIYHPALDDVGISAVIVEGISSWVHKGGLKFEATIDFIQYAPAPQTNASAAPSGAAVQGGILSNPLAAQPTPTAEQLLQQLQTQAQSPT